MTNEYQIESFISFCDEMIIEPIKPANEGIIKAIKKKLTDNINSAKTAEEVYKDIILDTTLYTELPETEDISRHMMSVFASPKGIDNKIVYNTGGVKEFVQFYEQGSDNF